MRRFLFALLTVLALGGCAHPISMTPDLTSMTGTGQAKLDRKVGLAISDEDRRREVTTPGGGGDMVSYFPYRDLEVGMYMALSETFAGVSRVGGPADPKVAAEGLGFVFVPRLLTTSSSASGLTWPPTDFNVILTCKVFDGAGKEVAELSARGQGHAEFDEFKKDYSLAARRASEDVVKKFIAIVGATPALR